MISLTYKFTEDAQGRVVLGLEIISSEATEGESRLSRSVHGMVDKALNSSGNVSPGTSNVFIVHADNEADVREQLRQWKERV